MKIQVTRNPWKFGRGTEAVPAIKIRTPRNYLHIPITEIREVVDACHGLADEHDREQREAANNE